MGQLESYIRNYDPVFRRAPVRKKIDAIDADMGERDVWSHDNPKTRGKECGDVVVLTEYASYDDLSSCNYHASNFGGNEANNYIFQNRVSNAP